MALDFIEDILKDSEYIKLSYHVPNIPNVRGREVPRPSDASKDVLADFERLKHGYLEYFGLVVERTLKHKVWKGVV